MAVQYLIFIVQLFYQESKAAPVNDTTRDGALRQSQSHTTYVGFVGDPNGRGTSSLVISCLLTLILCVWSALHLNVPSQVETHVSRLLVNARWVIIGIYAPELVVFTAWRQWSSAKILANLVRNLQVHDEKMLASNEWTMTHSFFACTGGFAFQLDNGETFLPADCPKRLTITARGMALLAKCGHLPDIPRAEIVDKSKANDLAKALVLVQALWMLLQVIERLIVRLPVTLLEVNTIAHVYVLTVLLSDTAR